MHLILTLLLLPIGLATWLQKSINLHVLSIVIGLLLVLFLVTCLLYTRYRKRMGALPIFSLLALTPVGHLFLAMLFCTGALGSGVVCHAPFAAGYLAGLQESAEFSCFFLICFFWIPVSVVVWVIAVPESLWRLSRVVLRRDIPE